jgi:two-component system, OmpR family, response regulator MtrA
MSRQINGDQERAYPNAVIMVTAQVDDVEAINELLERDTPVVLVPRAESVARLVRGQVKEREPARTGFEVGDLTIDLDKHAVYWRGVQVALSEQEINILICLARRPGHAYSFTEIFREVWGTSDHMDIMILHSAIQRLRRKLSAAHVSVRVQSLRGYGFRLGDTS